MENTSFYTYLHCRPDGSPFYVGKGKGERSGQFAVRKSHHKSIVAKYGRENIGVYIFPCESEEQAFQDEIQQIAQLRREGYDLCNHTDGGEGPSGLKHSKETREKMSVARIGKKRSAETCAKLSAVNTGKKLSAKHCAKISANQTGKKHSIETRAKMSAARVGKKHSVDTVTKMSVAAKARWARTKE